jgi:hypothetical protein
VIEVFEELQIAYMVVGSLASSAYGEPRMTLDIDIVVDMSYGQAYAFCEKFAAEDYYVSPQAAGQAVRTAGQFNLIHSTSGNKIDIMLVKPTAWGEGELARRQRIRLLPDRDGFTARPEDIIIAKMQYHREGGSDKHLRDITGILKVSGEIVDRDYVVTWARKLGLMDIWETILRRLEKP